MSLSLFIVLTLLSCVPAYAGNYTDSAHGSSSSGVDRQVIHDLGYSRGNCAHCHEMHASIKGAEPAPAGGAASPYALFAQNFDTTVISGSYAEANNFCFYCHNTTGSAQSVTNYDYSHVFGGATGGESSILDEFNQSSYHNLYDIWNFSRDAFPSWFKDNTNPCDACHNPHIAKRNWYEPQNPLLTAISKPSDHGSLWGDDEDETMKNYSSYYQAPYYYNSNTYEPAGTTSYDGSRVPDYNSFCTDCHNKDNTIFSHNLNRDLRKIDWVTTGNETDGGDKHGKNEATVSLNVRKPFASSSLGITKGFVLSCTDCHEPHGSPNVMLIRREVNGEDLPGDITSNDTVAWANLCGRCHKDDSFYGGTAGEFKYIHHYDKDAPYPGPPMGCCSCHDKDMGGGGMSKPPIKCNYCHFHGGNDRCLLDDSSKPYYPSQYTGRRCF